MLVLRRRDGQWLEIVHRSGDVLRLRVYDIKGDAPPRANLAFDDSARHFEIHRPERRRVSRQFESPASGCDRAPSGEEPIPDEAGTTGITASPLA